MRFYPVALAAGAFALASTVALASATAMTSGAEPDGDGHPAVVAMVVVDPEWDVASVYCSGTLIASTVVLTASHCNVISEESWFLEGGYELGVTNAADLPVDQSGYLFPWTGTGEQALVTEVHTNPLYRKGYRDDVSLQTIAHPLDGVGLNDMPKLPEVGLLDELRAKKTLQSTTSLVLGYGSEQKVIPANVGPGFPNTNQRRYAELQTTTIDKQSIHQSQNLAQGLEGACYGDSGGPTLMDIEGVTYVVGVTSTGDGPCFATNVAGRVDTPTARAFMDSVLAD